MDDRTTSTWPASLQPRSTSGDQRTGRTVLLLEGRVLSTLLPLSVPKVFNLLAIAEMITFDGLFLGRLRADALAGVSLALPFVMLMQHTATSDMGGGIASAIARALGARRPDVALTMSVVMLKTRLGLPALKPPAYQEVSREALGARAS